MRHYNFGREEGLPEKALRSGSVAVSGEQRADAIEGKGASLEVESDLEMAKEVEAE